MVTPHEMQKALRPRRRALVEAAESAMKSEFERRKLAEYKRPKLTKSQLNHLASVCLEAACAEEIENYLRYQASRKQASWPREAVDEVIDATKKGMPGESGDELRVATWRLFATYLTRSFTYLEASERQNAPDNAGRPPLGEGN
jgi:hypothetical protein